MSHGIGQAQRRLLASVAAVHDVLHIDAEVDLLLVLPGEHNRANLYRALSSLEGRGLVTLCRRYAAPPRERPCWQIRLTPEGRGLLHDDDLAPMLEYCRDLKREAEDFDTFLAHIVETLTCPS
jgi:hypothetical protein